MMSAAVTSNGLLRPERVVTPLEAKTLAEATLILARRLGEVGVVENADAVCDALAGLAGAAAVRIGEDVALPHYRTDAVNGVALGIGISVQPLETGNPEWTPGPRIVALVLAPTAATTAYLHTVSSLARALRAEGVLDRLLAARTPDAVMAVSGIAGIEVKPRLTVRDVMTAVPDTLAPELSVRTAVERMMRSGVRALVVVGEKREVLGVVSESDVMRGLGLDRTRPSAEPVLPPLQVRDVMTRSVMCTAERASLDEVASIMINKGVDEVPVVAEGRLTGIVRRGDILRTLYGR